MFTIYFVTKEILGAVIKILIIGASGKTGDLTWRKVFVKRYGVTGFDRLAAHRYEGNPLRKMFGDVFDSETVIHAVGVQQAVLAVSGRSTAVMRAV